MNWCRCIFALKFIHTSPSAQQGSADVYAKADCHCRSFIHQTRKTTKQKMLAEKVRDIWNFECASNWINNSNRCVIWIFSKRTTQPFLNIKIFRFEKKNGHYMLPCDRLTEWRPPDIWRCYEISSHSFSNKLIVQKLHWQFIQMT